MDPHPVWRPFAFEIVSFLQFATPSTDVDVLGSMSTLPQGSHLLRKEDVKRFLGASPRTSWRHFWASFHGASFVCLFCVPSQVAITEYNLASWMYGGGRQGRREAP